MKNKGMTTELLYGEVRGPLDDETHIKRILMDSTRKLMFWLCRLPWYTNK
jgi:hypothetical protein